MLFEIVDLWYKCTCQPSKYARLDVVTNSPEILQMIGVMRIVHSFIKSKTSKINLKLKAKTVAANDNPIRTKCVCQAAFHIFSLYLRSSMTYSTYLNWRKCFANCKGTNCMYGVNIANQIKCNQY